MSVILTDSTLFVTSALKRSDFAAFQRAWRSLHQSSWAAVTLDLTGCTYGSSTFIGEVTDAVVQMTAGGKEVVVLVSPELGRLLHMAHLYHLFQYTVVDNS